MKFNITFLPNLLLKNKESKNSVKKRESQQKRSQVSNEGNGMKNMIYNDYF